MEEDQTRRKERRLNTLLPEISTVPCLGQRFCLDWTFNCWWWQWCWLAHITRWHLNCWHWRRPDDYAASSTGECILVSGGELLGLQLGVTSLCQTLSRCKQISLILNFKTDKLLFFSYSWFFILYHICEMKRCNHLMKQNRKYDLYYDAMLEGSVVAYVTLPCRGAQLIFLDTWA